MKYSILVVDDDENVRESLCTFLKSEGYDVETASSGKKALEKTARNSFPLLITDLKLPDVDGLKLYENIKKAAPSTLAVIITGHASLNSAVEAIRAGAYDYVEKPFPMEKVLVIAKRAFEHAELLAQNTYLNEELKDRYHPDNIVGSHATIQKVFELIGKVARTEVTVLIRGESGTGKELAARAIHYISRRKNSKFVALSCGALPETLIESELFGYEKGAFTGAFSRKLGLFEIADGGTLFLDEIGDLSPATQVKLLRVIQEKEFQPVGGLKQIKVDVRLVSATNKDLEQAVKEGKFREDLYYRLNVVQIELPPLRDRKDDIPLLIKHFLKKFNSDKSVSKQAMGLLSRYNWPGNVRELENVIERAVALSEVKNITPEDLPKMLKEPVPGSEHVDVRLTGHIPPEDEISTITNFKKARDKFEEAFLRKSLDVCEGNISKAARKCGISRRHFYQKIKKYQMVRGQGLGEII